MSILPSSSGSDCPTPRELAAALRASTPGTDERRRLETAFAVRLLPGLLRSLRGRFAFGSQKTLPHDYAAYGDFWMDGAN